MVNPCGVPLLETAMAVTEASCMYKVVSPL